MKKRINKEIIIVAIISVLFLMMSIVYADYLYNSNQVSFNNNNTTLTSTDVQGAIDELYNKCSNVPAVGTCPEGYECTELNKVTYNANGGIFSGNATNNVYYSVVDNGVIEKISKTSNVDDEGNKTGYMPQASSGRTDTVTIDGAESLEVEIKYQTYSSSRSWVTVNDGDTTPSTSNYSSSVSGKLYGTTITTKTYTITGDTVKFFFYNYYSNTSSYSNYLGYYAKIKGKKNGEYIKELEVTKEEGEYIEPSKTNSVFIGWTLNPDGTGTVYRNENEVKSSLNSENKNIVLYAKWVTAICKRATSLHTETCTNSDSSHYCQGDGYSEGETITYGSLGTLGTLTSGDAFDCDVNGDGIYDSETERFYYVSNYFDTQSQTWDKDYAVFIYYSNTYGGVPDASHTVAWYSSSSTTSNGPITARNNLPKTTGENAWRDDLLKTRTRNILSGTTATTMTGTVKYNFNYEGSAARLLTIRELASGCSTLLSGGGTSGCNYFLERTKYSTNSYVAYGMWLETAYDSQRAWGLGTYYSRTGYSTSSYGSEYVSTSDHHGVRPAIEIPKTSISY